MRALSAPPKGAGEGKGQWSGRSRAGRGGKWNTEAEKEDLRERNRSLGTYMLAVAIFTIGMSYAAVPLYKLFCQVTGYGGTVQEVKQGKMKRLTRHDDEDDDDDGQGQEGDKAGNAKKGEGDGDDGLITITFTADTSLGMPWEFWPVQEDVRVKVGETALAFYTAQNMSDKAVTGVATYNVIPMKAGLYFNKIQCFCFDEQRLRAREEVDMPVFFFLDPDFADDPRMAGVRDVTLSYTFFRSDDQGADDEDDDGEPLVWTDTPDGAPPPVPENNHARVVA